MPELLLRRVVSGGQVGADEAGLAAAKLLGIETGGWMPAGWRTRSGPRPEYAELYGMTAAPRGGYPYRTRLNVRDSDATVRFAYNFASSGEVRTLRLCEELGRPVFDVPLSRPGPRARTAGAPAYIAAVEPAELRAWLVRRQVGVLNVAGNGDPAISVIVLTYLLAALAQAGSPPPTVAPVDIPAATQLPLLP